MSVELARPAWLVLLALLPIWAWWAWPRAGWGLLVAEGAEAPGFAVRRRTAAALEGAPLLLRALAAACVVLALARPQLVRTWEEPVPGAVGIAFAIDLSTSMWAQDMAERQTRLQVAKATVLRFLEGRAGDDVGLVSFAGEAHVRLPLTHDRWVARAAVEALEVGLLLDGTDVAGAIAVGAGLLSDAPHGSKVLVLVTDGAHNRAGLTPALAARAAAAVGVRIYPVAIGSEQGLADQAGMETVLTHAALVTGGRYFRATDAEALERISAEIAALAAPSVEVVERTERDPLGRWLLLASLPFLLAGLALRASRWGVLP